MGEVKRRENHGSKSDHEDIITLYVSLIESTFLNHCVFTGCSRIAQINLNSILP